MRDTASKKVLRRQLEREYKFLQRVKRFKLSPTIIAESERRRARLQERLSNDAD